MAGNEDLFDAIESLQEREMAVGYEEGKRKGQEEQFKEGFVLGWQQSCHVQQELGRIDGILAVVLLNFKSECDERTLRSIEKVQKLIKEYPNWGSNECDVECKLTTILNKVKPIFLKLKIPVKINNSGGESF